jgi:hypothetical protein
MRNRIRYKTNGEMPALERQTKGEMWEVMMTSTATEKGGKNFVAETGSWQKLARHTPPIG